MKFLRKRFYHIILIAAFSLPLTAHAALPDFTEIVAESKNSVVNISTKTKIKRSSAKKYNIPELPEGSPFGELFDKFFDHDEFDRRHRDAQSLGSGFIISDDGYILTNHHVIAGADEVIVRMADRKEYVAKLIGSDEASDVAATVTAGIVSAKGRSLPSDNYVPFIQTDVAINPGNSGGPLFNLDGEVVGINSQIYSRSGGFMGLSFAIPIEMAVDVADQIKETGSVSRGWLGVLIQEVTRELAESFGMDNPHGALVAKVLDDSPAAEAGLEVGDVIVEFNGKKVIRSSGLPPLVGRAKVGREASLTVIRDKKRKKIGVVIAQLPTSITQAALTPEKDLAGKDSALGMQVEALSSEARKRLKIEAGVQVVEVDESGPASDAGIQKGDVITMIDNREIETIDDFEQITDQLKSGKSVALLVQRRAGPVFLAIRPEDS